MSKAIKEHRINSVLDTQVFYGKELGTLTRRCWLQHMKEHGASVEVSQVPSVKYNRVKYNGMDEREHSVYDKKLEKMKSEYRLWGTSSIFWTVTKIEYDYFVSIGGSKKGDS